MGVFQMNLCHKDSARSVGNRDHRRVRPAFCRLPSAQPKERSAAIVSWGTKADLAPNEEWAELWLSRSHSDGPLCVAGTDEGPGEDGQDPNRTD